MKQDYPVPGIITEDNTVFASVVVPVVDVDGKKHILFERRSSAVKDQPGDVCFPGGSIESGESPMEAAIRECREELLVKDEQISITGTLPVLSRLGLLIYPFTCELTDYDFSFDEETSEVFTVPLEYLCSAKPERHTTEWNVTMGEDFPTELVNGGKNYKWRKHREEHLFYKYEDKVIWGYTAKILKCFLDRISDIKEDAK